MASPTLCKPLKSLDMPILNKWRLPLISIYFCSVITHKVNITETFTDILTHYFLKVNAIKFLKCVTMNYLKWIQ